MSDGKKNIILTGDRPTGPLHIGHYVGSLKRRVALQESGKFDDIYILIADAQALTDNADNPKKIRDNIIEVTLDYLSTGIDPEKTTICIQSELPALYELTAYYMNLVTTARLERNPTVKSEIKMRGFNEGGAGLPVGFYTYPISQAADITAFKANCVPVGEDQMPMLEQCKEIVHKFNSTYGEVLVDPQILLNDNLACRRLPGTDGKAKMSKSLGNCIYLHASKEEVHQKVMSMFTDPDHINVSDPGKVEGNCVFTSEQIKKRMDTVQERIVRLIQDIESIQSSYGEAKSIAEEIAMQHQNLLSWAQIFDAASIPEKKVIASQIIKAVTLTRNYGIQIEFRISEAQFLNGMDMS